METHSSRDDNRFLRFSGITLDFGTRAVLREAGTVYPPEEYWKALALLVERRPHIVLKEDLSKVLGCSTDGTLTKQMERIRKSLGDTTRPWRFIKSERKIGYRWIAEGDDRAPATAPRGEISVATQLDLLTTEHLASVPEPQKTIWGPLHGLATGVYLDSLLGVFISWTELKPEIEERLLSQLGCHQCTVALGGDYSSAIFPALPIQMHIINPAGNPIGDVSFDSHPDWDVRCDLLVHVCFDTRVRYDSPVFWHECQRYSDGTYRCLSTRVTIED